MTTVNKPTSIPHDTQLPVPDRGELLARVYRLILTATTPRPVPVDTANEQAQIEPVAEVQ